MWECGDNIYNITGGKEREKQSYITHHAANILSAS